MRLAAQPELRKRFKNVFAVAWHHDERVRTNALHHMLRLHRGHRDAPDDCIHVAPWPNRLPLQAILNDRERWVGEDLPIRKYAEEWNLVARQSLLQEARELWLHLQVDLVHDRPCDLHTPRSEECSVENDLIDRSTDPTFTDDDDWRTE